MTSTIRLKITSLILITALLIPPPLTLSAFSKENKTVNAGVSDYRLDAVNIGWWDNFNDPHLKEYIYKAVKNNHDLKIASLKTQEYYQNVLVTRAAELPTVSFLPNYARVRTPGVDFSGVPIDAQGMNLFAVPLVASYEADIFLKNHDKTKSARKKYEASKYEEKAAYISLATSTATTYFNIVQLDKLITVQEEVLKIRSKIFELTKERYKAGLSSSFDVAQSDKQHTAAMISLNDFKKQRAMLLHQLAVFIGESPADVENIERSSLDEIEYKGNLPDSISSEVVVQRPDLMKAEAQLAAAKIDVRAARKEFLPNIPILGAAGWVATDISRMFDWKNFLALIGVGLSQKVFTGGRLKAGLKLKKIAYEEMFENYKQVDLQALQEINDSLCQVKYDTQKDNDNIKKYHLEEYNFGLINARYVSGITSYYDMIQFKESLLALEQEKAASKTQRLVDYLSLYKSVGAAL